MTFDDFTDMRAIAGRIAPEVNQSPYIVWQADLPGLPEPIETGAYASQNPSPALRQALQDAGLWRGPAPAIVFVSPLSDRWEGYGRFLHEMGHLLPFTPVVDKVCTPAELDLSQRAVAEWAASPDEPDGVGLPRWAPDHGRHFVRIVSHLWYRALELCCLDIPTRWVLHWEYDLSPLDDYIAVLGPELQATDPRSPFADILAAPAPHAFTDLFERDKAEWLSRIHIGNRSNEQNFSDDATRSWRAREAASFAE